MTIPQPPPQKPSTHKKKKKKSAKRVGPSDEDLATSPDISRPQHSLSSSLPSIPQTQAELLATANDLYRQIETAAASALSSGAHGGAGDDEYWNNLPAHLRSFIRYIYLFNMLIYLLLLVLICLWFWLHYISDLHYLSGQMVTRLH